MLLRRIERSAEQWTLQPDDCSLDRELTAAQQMASMKQPQLAGIAAQPKRLAGVDRRDADTKPPRVSGVDHAGDLVA